MKHTKDLQRAPTASKGWQFCQILTGPGSLLFCLLLSSVVIARSADAQEKKKAFGVIPVQLANPFFAEIERGAKEQANKLGVECIYTASKTANEAEQIQVFRDLVTHGVNGIAIAPINGGALVGPISEARCPNCSGCSDKISGSGWFLLCRRLADVRPPSLY